MPLEDTREANADVMSKILQGGDVALQSLTYIINLQNVIRQVFDSNENLQEEVNFD